MDWDFLILFMFAIPPTAWSRPEPAERQGREEAKKPPWVTGDLLLGLGRLLRGGIDLRADRKRREDDILAILDGESKAQLMQTGESASSRGLEKPCCGKQKRARPRVLFRIGSSAYSPHAREQDAQTN